MAHGGRQNRFRIGRRHGLRLSLHHAGAHGFPPSSQHLIAIGALVALNQRDEIGVATSRDILAAIAQGEGPAHAVVALGYAGWGAGQLERELADNAWLSGPVDTSIIFDQPYEDRWASAARLLGVDPHMISGEAGHS